MGHLRLLDFLTRRFYPGLDAVVCQSADMHRELVARYGLSPDKLRPLPNPVDVTAVSRASLEAPDTPLPPVPFFLAAGRLSPEKDFALLITAFSRLENRRSHLLILGEGPLRDALAGLAGRLGVAGRVHLPGAARRPFPAMARAAAYVLSSAYDSFPNVLLEAGACGTPVVAGRCPGAAREIVEEGVTGLTVPPGDADALAAAMDRALAASFDREAIRARTRERFDIGVVIPAYENVLEEG